MLQVKINNKIYELPLGELYRDRFSAHITKDILCFDNIEDNINLKYNKVSELFGFVTKSFQMVIGSMEEDCNYKYAKDSLELRKKVEPVDHLQRFYYKKGRLDKSIDLMNNLMEEMLKLYVKTMDEDRRKTIKR